MDEIHEQSFGNNDDNQNQIPYNINYQSLENDNPNIINKNNDINSIDNDIISKQNKNYQNQILLLTQRIKEYEKDYINKNSREEKQIKEFMSLESNLKKQINEKTEIISELEHENNFLKEQLNHMENNFEQLKEEVKRLIELKIENPKKEIIDNNIINNPNIINPKETINFNLNQSNDLLELTKKYSLEISKLRKQNEILTNTIQNQNINNINNNNINNNNALLNNKINIDTILGNYANEINKEIFIISRWIDTYLVCEFNKDFDIPPLINEENDIENPNPKINLIDFKILKRSLDNALQNLNNIINSKETEIIEINNALNEKEVKYSELKKELSETKKYLYQLKNEKEGLIQKIEQNKKEIQLNMDNINNIKGSSNKDKENQIRYLSNIYSIINKEINSILQDINFKSYHDKFIPIVKDDKTKNINLNINNNSSNIPNIEEILFNSFNKLIEFLEELKYDYIETKKENLNIIKEKAVDSIKLLKNENEQNMNQDQIELYNQKIEQLLNDNKLLKEQIEINNKKNQLKEISNNDNMIKYEDLEKQIYDLKQNNNDLQKKLKNMNEGNFELEKRNNNLENEIEKLKNYENMIEELKEKYDNLTFDYQRIQKENNSLKNIINNQ